MDESVPVPFTRDELWLLQSLVRHEQREKDGWRFPPFSLDLNDEIAHALFVCHEYDLGEVTLPLSRGDLLLIDYLVPQTAKSPTGTLIGKEILLKSFKAREPAQVEAAEPSRPALAERLKEWRNQDASPGNDPGPNPDNDSGDLSLAGEIY